MDAIWLAFRSRHLASHPLNCRRPADRDSVDGRQRSWLSWIGSPKDFQIELGLIDCGASLRIWRQKALYHFVCAEDKSILRPSTGNGSTISAKQHSPAVLGDDASSAVAEVGISSWRSSL